MLAKCVTMMVVVQSRRRAGNDLTRYEWGRLPTCATVIVVVQSRRRAGNDRGRKKRVEAIL